MPSSTSSFSPLFADLRTQRRPLGRFALELVAFCLIVLCLDRALDAVLRHGLDKYYKLGEPAAVLCVGHSHTILGLDGELLERSLGAPVTKYAADGVGTIDRLAMIKHYFSRQKAPPPAVVIYDVDGYTFTSEGLASNAYRQFFPYMDEPEMSSFIRDCCTSKSDLAMRELLRSLRYDESLISRAVRGYAGYRTNLKVGRLDPARVKRQIEDNRVRRPKIDLDNVHCFEQTMKTVLSHGSKFVMVYVPTTDLINSVDGPTQRRVVDMLRAYASTRQGVYFLDYNKGYESSYDLFSDPVHLNREGQRVVTEKLAADLRAIICTPPTSGTGFGRDGLDSDLRSGETTQSGAAARLVLHLSESDGGDGSLCPGDRALARAILWFGRRGIHPRSSRSMRARQPPKVVPAAGTGPDGFSGLWARSAEGLPFAPLHFVPSHEGNGTSSMEGSSVCSCECTSCGSW